ncbi:MAG: hypothetical protein H0T64_12970 [Pyrinomonadaceae bacterium]|nr:hypothetical protein [Pyrinomonadaceae bacterium]
MADVEVRAQGQYALAPPSVWKNGPIHAPYEFLKKPPSIIEIASLDEIHWLKLEPVAALLRPAPEKKLPVWFLPAAAARRSRWW